MNPYQKFIEQFSNAFQEGKNSPLGNLSPELVVDIPANAPKALIFSPHPDDECIIGGLALRLLREAKMNVINVAVTQGSNKERQAGRLEELKNACDYLGFGLIQTKPNGLDKIKRETKIDDPELWNKSVQIISSILKDNQPKVIFVPHEKDWNSTHIGTHDLVLDALKISGNDLNCFVVETEFWGQNDNPNLMVESSQKDVGDMVAALTFHIKEVERNPYHLRLPAWMIDNVRRGAELVGGQGMESPDFTYATLYKINYWDGKLSLWGDNKFLSIYEDPGSLF